MSDRIHQKTSAMWEAFLKGDDHAFASFYFLNINKLLAYGRKITHDSDLLRDAIQEVFVDIYEKRDRPHAHIENPGAWLMVALRNNIYKKKESSRKSATHGLSLVQVEEFNVEYSFQETLINHEMTRELLANLRAAIQQLSSGQKEVIYLRYEAGLPYPDIAGIMQITVESARKQLHRAILSLRKILDSKSIIALFLIFS
jgi:RNA polymerase sigma factor (sigma-70 family)